MKIRVKFKWVTVYEQDVELDIDPKDLGKYQRENPRFSPDEIEKVAMQMTWDDSIDLHHSHYKKLQKSGLVGWFDFKVTKKRGSNNA